MSAAIPRPYCFFRCLKNQPSCNKTFTVFPLLFFSTLEQSIKILNNRKGTKLKLFEI